MVDDDSFIQFNSSPCEMYNNRNVFRTSALTESLAHIPIYLVDQLYYYLLNGVLCGRQYKLLSVVSIPNSHCQWPTRSIILLLSPHPQQSQLKCM